MPNEKGEEIVHGVETSGERREEQETDQQRFDRLSADADEVIYDFVEEGRMFDEKEADDELQVELSALEQEARVARSALDVRLRRARDVFREAAAQPFQNKIDALRAVGCSEAEIPFVILEEGDIHDVTFLMTRLDLFPMDRRLLALAKEKDRSLYGRMCMLMVMDQEQYPLDDDLAQEFAEQGYGHVVAARLGEVERPSLDLAKKLLEKGEGWTVLAKREKFGLAIDEAVIDQMVAANSLTDEVAVELRAALQSPERVGEIIDRERMVSLKVFLTAHESLPDCVGDEKFETARARDRLASEAAADAPLFRAFQERHGADALHRVLYALDSTRPSWKKSVDWHESMRVGFEVPDEMLVSKEYVEGLSRALRKKTDDVEEDAVAMDAFLRERWMAEQALAVNVAGVERMLEKVVPLEKDNFEQFEEGKEIWDNIQLLLLNARTTSAKERYIGMALKLFADERLCFTATQFRSPIYPLSASYFFAEYVYDMASVNSEIAKAAYTRFINVTESGHRYSRVVPAAFEAFYGEDLDEIVDLTLAAAGDVDDPEEAKFLIQGALVSSWRERLVERGVHVLEQQGIHVDEKMLTTWRRCAPESARERAVTAGDAIKTMVALEHERPGCTEALHQQFGIDNFGRYPKEMLIAQFDARDDVEKPYGVVIYPKSDYNGAFGGPHGQKLMGSLYQQVKGQYHVRVFEAESRLSVARTLITTKKRYADHGAGKIGFAVVGGHGSPDSIQFGDGSEQSHLRIEDFAGRGVGRSGAFLEPGATVVLKSCSTGVEGGIGQRMSEALQINVVGPDKPTYVENIAVDFNEQGKPTLRVQYAESAPQEYMAGQKV